MLAPMTQTTPGSADHLAANAEINQAFVIRLTWERASDQWRVLLKPVNGGTARLFGDVESALVYLEAVMRKAQRKE